MHAFPYSSTAFGFGTDEFLSDWGSIDPIHTINQSILKHNIFQKFIHVTIIPLLISAFIYDSSASYQASRCTSFMLWVLVGVHLMGDLD